jgi:hypothetical protein
MAFKISDALQKLKNKDSNLFVITENIQDTNFDPESKIYTHDQFLDFMKNSRHTMPTFYPPPIAAICLKCKKTFFISHYEPLRETCGDCKLEDIQNFQELKNNFDFVIQ